MKLTVGDTTPRTLTVGVDLTGAASVTLHVHPFADRTTLVDTAALTVTDATTGEVEWTPDGTLAAGTYVLDVELDGPTGTAVTEPISLFVMAHASV